MKKKPPIKRRIPGKMNKTEEKYAEQLNLLKAAGEVESWKFEAVKFKLAHNTTYLPDFQVVYPDRIEYHEIKGGYIFDKGKVKFKVAANMFPEFGWKMIQWKSKQWNILESL